MAEPHSTLPPSSDRQESLVAGVYMDRSIADFQRSCEVHIAEEQRKPNPDNALIALLCDAVRCSRELCEWAGKFAGVNLIMHERLRQVTVKKWTPAHDDAHTDGILAAAAACLAVEGTDGEFTWPDYEISWIKDLRDKHAGGDRIRQLEIAGALIAAEIDRIQRRDSPK